MKIYFFLNITSPKKIHLFLKKLSIEHRDTMMLIAINASMQLSKGRMTGRHTSQLTIRNTDGYRCTLCIGACVSEGSALVTRTLLLHAM